MENAPCKRFCHSFWESGGMIKNTHRPIRPAPLLVSTMRWGQVAPASSYRRRRLQQYWWVFYRCRMGRARRHRWNHLQPNQRVVPALQYVEEFFLAMETQLLSGSARACYPQHHGSRRCKAVGCTEVERGRRWEKWRDRRWSEWRGRRGHSHVRMKHDDDDGANRAQTWATVCVSIKEDSQRTTTQTDNKKYRDYENERSSMHEDSSIDINYVHMFSKCFRSLHTLLGFVLCFMSSIQLLLV